MSDDGPARGRRTRVFSEFDPGDLPAQSGALTVAARYSHQEEIGKGGMSVVVRATDTLLEREVALKIKSPGAPADRFRREQTMHAALRHPAFLPVFDAGWTSQGEPYYVLPLLDGEDLDDVVRSSVDEVRPLRWRVDVVRQVALALAYLHKRHGISHGDPSPHNVRIGTGGEVYLLDLGLARYSDEAPASGGTRGYCAPERLSGATPQTDIWALGAILARVSTGSESGLPEDLELASAIRMMKAVDPSQRPTAGDVADDLARWLAGELLHIHRYGAIERFERSIRRQPERWLIRGLTLVMILLVMVLITR